MFCTLRISTDQDRVNLLGGQHRCLNLLEKFFIKNLFLSTNQIKSGETFTDFCLNPLTMLIEKN